jgi:hypothetical protein
MPRALLLLALLAFLPSCAASREEKYASAATLERPPSNFTLSITVQGPYTRVAPDRDSRPARYILEADGLLRTALTRAATEELYPPQTRRLSDEDVRRVWLTLKNGPLFRIDHPAIVPLPPSSDSSTPPPKTTTYTITYIAADVRQILLLSADRPGAEDVPAAAQLTDELAGMAWVQ